ncbi:MAG: sigma-70 family RNA polymerase sigma factor [Pseudomonadota bacterium]
MTVNLRVAPSGAATFEFMSDDDSTSDEIRWAKLMVSAQAGNEHDYRSLLTEISRATKHYLLSRFGAQHFIDDCVQDTLIAVHQARHTYDSRRRFRPWLFAIVRHKAIDTLRKQRSQRDLAEHQEALMQEAQRDTIDLDNSVAQGQLLDGLSPQHKEVLTLTKFIGLSNAEAAAKLRISESAVKVRVHRAIGSLTRLMEAEA